MSVTNSIAQASTPGPSNHQRSNRWRRKPQREGQQKINVQEGQEDTTDNQGSGVSAGNSELEGGASPAPRPVPVAASGNDATESARGGGGRGRGRGGRVERGFRGVAGQNLNRRGINARIGGSINGENHRQTTDINRESSRFNSGRQFCGRLTKANETNLHLSTPSTLQGDAPEFHPGRPHTQRSNASQRAKPAPTPQKHTHEKPTRVRKNSVHKSTAADIPTRTHEDILNGAYECPICTSEVARSSKVWSCKTCWTVFHLTCIKKWSTNEGSTLTQQRNAEGDLPPPRQWRCPGCNLPKDTLPSTYTCWCEKEIDPRPISGIPPHSCGQTCGKSRVFPKKCPHPCELLCHAGPCPPCTHVGPVQSCFCGKKSTSRRCIDTNYDTGWSCGDVCGDIMSCGTHACQRPCHEGLCGACEVKTDCRCYCGKAEKQILCHERGNEKQSEVLIDDGSATGAEIWVGSFECNEKCQRPFDCGKHFCNKSCHPQDIDIPHCPQSPNIVSCCPCGKTLLIEISNEPRMSCEDPVPNCQKQCSKTLPCGHFCQQICHTDVCMPCLEVVTLGCRCGRVQSTTVCHQGNEEPPHCLRTCKAALNCGRHECGEHCCLGERKASERQATKRKLRPLGASRIIDEGFEAEHICTRVCGRLLKCGNHPCPELCHKGPCASCREAVFDEISCHCGKTVLQPPLPCGTNPPPCRFDCERVKLCRHPRIPHNCHGDEEICPKCPFLEEKPCMCGKKNLKNQPCWLTEVRCGEICRRKLRCGSHFCRKPCHRDGECEDAAKVCQQACGKAKKSCGHPCEDLCHAPSSCKEDKPCQNKMLVTCDCQHLKQELKCNASKKSDGNSKKSLNCDDECARLERNRKLALALNIDPEAHKDDHIPYSNETLNMFRENLKWAQSHEREFRIFAADESEKRLRFKPMVPHLRSFLHSLADDFGFDSESMDPEPHRHVAVFKTPRFVMAPMKTLAECVRIRAATEALNTAVSESQKKTSRSNEPYNGFVMTHPRFGLTLEEIRIDYSTVLDSTPGLIFDISFLPSEEIVLKARPLTPFSKMSTSSIDSALKVLKAPLSATTSSLNLANSIQLCTLDTSLNILRREHDDVIDNGGWSQIAAKAAAPRSAPKQPAFGEKSVYTVLGSRLKDAKKKKVEMQKAKVEEPVVEDWEEEMRREEAAEEKGKGNGAVEQIPSFESVVEIETKEPAIPESPDTNHGPNVDEPFQPTSSGNN